MVQQYIMPSRFVLVDICIHCILDTTVIRDIKLNSYVNKNMTSVCFLFGFSSSS